MNYKLVKDVIDLIAQFEIENKRAVPESEPTVEHFKQWIATHSQSDNRLDEPFWDGKEKGRSADSVINTLIVHMNRYAKSYSKSAIYGSPFSSQEDFIYLINLKAFGEMTKMDLIKKNVHEKPSGMQIINRLIGQGWVSQKASEDDKRSKVISISEKGMEVLAVHMDKIRQATEIVTGDLTHPEKMELIRLLHKLNDYHQIIYEKNIDSEHLLQEAQKEKKI
ncbi:MarR family winged helix-turn-helix transcriptional regulator [Sphingobacterium sp. FBM7-1]|uniref:MarR family winged helix-turn-helix transcriptional regulator n=1 Tax=Sphingobacterium sp. FBM7-1 TaxID=2886688 RepID=UPI001D11CB07|nr:helix-turn-helix domain-containing protein [Sphingobacterium sp. FBM7-1]MCC2598582.1 MarR family winged helix-turn-helix transcriptional regulator [Sphingobacterium sp. FBM7-1]